MLYAFWDVGPLFFRDWVDTSVMVRHLFGEDGTDSRFWIFFLGMSQDGLRIQPEGLVNLNAMLIMFTCFIVAGWSALMKASCSASRPARPLKPISPKTLVHGCTTRTSHG